MRASTVYEGIHGAVTCAGERRWTRREAERGLLIRGLEGLGTGALPTRLYLGTR